MGKRNCRRRDTMTNVSLNTHLDMSGSECLNMSDDHPLENCLLDNGSFLKSDCDEQLILSLAFNQVVKVQSLKIKAPSSSGPKTLRIFKNQPRTLDFGQAESFESIQDVDLSTDQLKGEKDVTLKFVKFQDVQNIQLFVKDNQNDEEVTEIEYLEIFGSPVATTNMKELKKKG